MSWSLYLKQVLGVSQIMGPVPSAAGAAQLEPAQTATPESTRILFVGEVEAIPLSELELFAKMLAAMRLQEDEFQIWELSAVDLAVREQEIQEAWVVVAFSKTLADFLHKQRSRLTVIATPAPMEVQKDPRLKRQVWDDLKQALEKSGLSARLQS